MKNYNYYDEEKPIETPIETEYGCKFCWDRRTKKEKELFFFDAANNLRPCYFCPNCGRQYMAEEE